MHKAQQKVSLHKMLELRESFYTRQQVSDILTYVTYCFLYIRISGNNTVYWPAKSPDLLALGFCFCVAHGTVDFLYVYIIYMKQRYFYKKKCFRMSKITFLKPTALYLHARYVMMRHWKNRKLHNPTINRRYHKIALVWSLTGDDTNNGSRHLRNSRMGNSR